MRARVRRQNYVAVLRQRQQRKRRDLSRPEILKGSDSHHFLGVVQYVGARGCLGFGSSLSAGAFTGGTVVASTE